MYAPAIVVPEPPRDLAARAGATSGACLVDRDAQVVFFDAVAGRLAPLRVGARLDAALPWAPASFDEPGSAEGVVDGRRLRLGWTPVTGPLGLLHAVVVLEDREPAHALEDALRVANETLRSLVDACPVGIVTLDVDMRVSRWNPASEAIFGWTSEEVLGEPYPIVPRDEWPTFEKLFRRVMDGEGFTGVEGRRARKDGSLVDLRIHTAAMRDPSGTVVGALALLEDLSERRKLEERVRHAQTMESVGRLAGGVAHDFNNMLAVILGISELLLRNSDHDDKDLDRGLHEIHACAERARKLTAQLLAFSRQQVLRPEVRELHALVDNARPLLRSVLGEEVVLVHAAPSAAVAAARVRVDTNQLDQVLVNLAANARAAMPRGGTFTLRLREGTGPRSAEHAGSAFVLLEVEDTGEGIPAEILPNVFDPFFTTKAEGTGLGLASVYGMVQQTGGFIEVESTLGRGTTFRIHFPVVSEPPEQPRSAPREGGSDGLLHGVEHVLLVEDDGVVRMVTAKMLGALGYRVTTAVDGQDGLAVLAQHPDVELVVTDLSMPRVGGRAFSQELERSHPHLPVVFMSAHLDIPDLRARVEAGQAWFVQKPASLEQLALQIRAALVAAAHDSVGAVERGQRH